MGTHDHPGKPTFSPLWRSATEPFGSGVMLALGGAAGLSVLGTSWVAPQVSQSTLGMIQGATGALAFLLGITLIKANARSRGWRRVRDALLAIDQTGGETNALYVDGESPECTAWNRVVDGAIATIDEQLSSAAKEVIGRSAGGMLRSACDAMSMGVIILDQQATIRFVNGAAVTFLHRDRSAMTGQSLTEILKDAAAVALIKGVCSESPRRGAIELSRNTLIGLEPSSGTPEGHSSAANGGSSSGTTGAILRVAVRPLRDQDEASAVVYIEDVTQQHIATEARGQFVAHATHELRTPLTNIKIYVEEMQDAPDDDGLRARALNVIDQEVRRLDRTIGEMLSVSEMDAGVLSLHMGDVRWDAIFETMRRDYAPSAKDRGLELAWDLPPKLPVVPGDRIKLETAVHNLLGNAIKYTPTGGRITVRVPETPGRFTVEIEDTGIGIAPDAQDRIFERYGRAEDDRVKSIVGTGLGLTLAREIARLHQGDVTLESELNAGSTFAMWIPHPEVQAAAA